MGWLVRMSYIELCWNDLFLSFAALISSPILGPGNTSGTNGSGDELEQDVQ